MAASEDRRGSFPRLRGTDADSPSGESAGFRATTLRGTTACRRTEEWRCAFGLWIFSEIRMRSKRGLSVPRSLGKRKTSPICGIARFRMPETARRFFHRMAPLVFIRQKFFCIKVALQKGPMLWRLVRKAACVLRRLVGERSAPQNGALFRAENQKAIERQVRPLASSACTEWRKPPAR